MKNRAKHKQVLYKDFIAGMNSVLWPWSMLLAPYLKHLFLFCLENMLGCVYWYFYSISKGYPFVIFSFRKLFHKNIPTYTHTACNIHALSIPTCSSADKGQNVFLVPPDVGLVSRTTAVLNLCNSPHSHLGNRSCLLLLAACCAAPSEQVCISGKETAVKWDFINKSTAWNH